MVSSTVLPYESLLVPASFELNQRTKLQSAEANQRWEKVHYAPDPWSIVRGLALMKIERRYLSAIDVSKVVQIFVSRKNRRQKFLWIQQFTNSLKLSAYSYISLQPETFLHMKLIFQDLIFYE